MLFGQEAEFLACARYWWVIAIARGREHFLLALLF